jgi:hypothetical protein
MGERNMRYHHHHVLSLLHSNNNSFGQVSRFFAQDTAFVDSDSTIKWLKFRKWYLYSSSTAHTIARNSAALESLIPAGAENFARVKPSSLRSHSVTLPKSPHSHFVSHSHCPNDGTCHQHHISICDDYYSIPSHATSLRPQC